MKHYLARIRMEAAVDYAIKHPEVRLGDIGLAIGFPETTAKTMISIGLKRQGFQRPRGFAAPGYDSELRAELTGSRPRIDRNEMRSLLMQTEPQISYEAIGKKVGCHIMSVVQIAAELGLSRGSTRRTRRSPLVATDAEIKKYFRSNPRSNLSQAARTLGFAKGDSVKKRVIRLGIKLLKAA